MTNPSADVPLLPCPFCGTQPRIQNAFDDMRSVVVRCGKCGASSVTCEYEKGLRASAVSHVVKAWNHRAPVVARGVPPEDKIYLPSENAP